jgi:hypothetical protein
MTTLVVGWNSNIDEFSWGVGIAESNDRNVDVGSFFDSLGVGAGIGDNDEAGFLEGSSNVVGEVTRGETTSDGDGTGVCGKLQDSALTVGASRDDTDIGRVVNSCDDTGCEDDFLPVVNMLEYSLCLLQRLRSSQNILIPGLANVDDIDSIRASLPEVRFHVNLQILRSEVALASQEHLNVLGGGIENRGKVGRSHPCDLTMKRVKSVDGGCGLSDFRGEDLEDKIFHVCAKIKFGDRPKRALTA